MGVLTLKKTNSENYLHIRPKGKTKGIIKKNNILDLKMCTLNWCKVSQNNLTGWILKEKIWGVYKTEFYNIKFYQPLIEQLWRILNNKIFN